MTEREQLGGPAAVSPADVARRLPVGELVWDDLVVPEALRARLHELVALAVPGGLTVAVSGPAGVGKTFAVRVWAEAMRIDLWRVDCAALMARHGAAVTRRGLDEVLPLGEQPHAILLFHGAEALLEPAGDTLAALLERVAARRAPTVIESRDASLDACLPGRVERVSLPFPDAGGGGRRRALRGAPRSSSRARARSPGPTSTRWRPSRSPAPRSPRLCAGSCSITATSSCPPTCSSEPPGRPGDDRPGLLTPGGPRRGRSGAGRGRPSRRRCAGRRPTRQRRVGDVGRRCGATRLRGGRSPA